MGASPMEEQGCASQTGSICPSLGTYARLDASVELSQRQAVSHVHPQRTAEVDMDGRLEARTRTVGVISWHRVRLGPAVTDGWEEVV